MYLVTLDDLILHNPEIKDYQIYGGKVNLEVNKSGSFTFTIYPSNPNYNNIQRLKSIIEVYDNGELIFRGRPLNDTTGINKEVTIICEGELGYLNDSVLEPYSFSGSITDYLQNAITSHNSQVENKKQFQLGAVTVTDPNNYIVRSNINHVSTWEEIKTKLIDNLGGYLRVRRVGEVNYLDYLSDSNQITNQTIELTKNILSYQQEVKAQDIITVMIPLGAKLLDEEGNETDERLTIESVNNGKKYIEHTSGIVKYGRIYGFRVFDDITTPNALKGRGESTLNNLVNLGVSIQIKALDMKFATDEQRIGFFDYVRIISKPHNIDEDFLVRKQTIDLDYPENNIIEVGIETDSFTVKQLESEYVIKQIKSDYVTNQKLYGLSEALHTQMSEIIQEADLISLKVEEVIGTTTTNTTHISQLMLDTESIRLEVSQLGGYNIISNIIGRYGFLDWTFESKPFIAKDSPPYALAFPPDLSIPKTFWISENDPIATPVETDTQSQSGFQFWHEGKMLSRIVPAEGGSNYSLYMRTKGTGTVTIKLREYTQALETNKANYHKETTLGTTNTTTNWATFTSTTLLDENTQSVCLVFESNVNVYLQEYAILSDSSFNLGQPKAYGQSLTDVNNRVDSLSARVDLYDDTINLFTQKVSDVEGQVTNQQAQININSGEITSRVKKDEIISEINQTSETVKINASRINLTGYVTVSSLSTAGQTVINGSNITTGTINANNVSVTNLNASSITAGTLNVNRIPNLNASKITAGTINVNRIAANSITAGKISVSPISQLSSALGTMNSGAVNNGSFSYGAFGGTGNFPSGTLGSSSYGSVSGGVSFGGSISGGHRYAGGYNTSDIGSNDRPFRTIYYATALNKVSDIRRKNNFVSVDDEFNEFIYSLPIGKYSLKGDDKGIQHLGINANFVDNLFPKEVTKYLINQDEAGYYSADYVSLVPMLVKVVQEQHHRLIDLEYRLSN